MWKGKKPAKNIKDKANVLRRFLSGEDVASEILKPLIERVEGFVFVNAITGEVMPFEWHEVKTYPDSQFPDVRMVNPENAREDVQDRPNSGDLEIPEHSDSSENKSVKELTPQQRRRLFLQEKLKALAEQERLDLQVREKCVIWNNMQNDLRGYNQSPY